MKELTVQTTFKLMYKMWKQLAKTGASKGSILGGCMYLNNCPACEYMNQQAIKDGSAGIGENLTSKENCRKFCPMYNKWPNLIEGGTTATCGATGSVYFNWLMGDVAFRRECANIIAKVAKKGWKEAKRKG